MIKRNNFMPVAVGLIFGLFCLKKVRSSAEDIVKFCRDNGEDFIAFTYDGDAHINDTFLFNLGMLMSDYGIRTRKLTLSDTIKENVVDMEETKVVFAQDLRHVEHFKQFILVSRKPKSVILVLITPQDDATDKIVKASTHAFSNLKSDSLFYMAQLKHNHTLVWHYVVTFKGLNHVVTNPVSFKKGTMAIIERYDFQGVVLTSISYDSHPLFSMNNCLKFDLNCQGSGILDDYYKTLQEMFNFTLIYDKQGDGKLGSKTEHYDEWNGILEKVYYREYHMSIGPWTIDPEKYKYFDLPPGLPNSYLLITNDETPVFGMSIMYKTLRPDTWIGVVITAISILSLLYLIKLTAKTKPEQIDRKASYRFALTSGWLFFYLVLMWIEGGLTTFLVEFDPNPLGDFKDAIDDFPFWKLHTEVNDSSVGEKSIGLVSSYADYMEWRSEDGILTGMEQAMDVLKEFKGLVRVKEENFLPYAQSLPFNPTSLKIIQREMPVYIGALLPKNSPLTPAFLMANKWINDGGIPARMKEKWLGKSSLPTTHIKDLVALSAEHIMLLNYVVYYGSLIAGGIAILEFIANTLWNLLNVNK